MCSPRKKGSSRAMASLHTDPRVTCACCCVVCPIKWARQVAYPCAAHYAGAASRCATCDLYGTDCAFPPCCLSLGARSGVISDPGRGRCVRMGKFLMAKSQLYRPRSKREMFWCSSVFRDLQDVLLSTLFRSCKPKHPPKFRQHLYNFHRTFCHNMSQF